MEIISISLIHFGIRFFSGESCTSTIWPLSVEQTHLRCDFLKQIFFIFVDFVSFAGAHCYFFIQFLNVGDIRIWYLLYYLDDVRKFRTQNFVNLHSQGDQCGLHNKQMYEKGVCLFFVAVHFRNKFGPYLVAFMLAMYLQTL